MLLGLEGCYFIGTYEYFELDSTSIETKINPVDFEVEIKLGSYGLNNVSRIPFIIGSVQKRDPFEFLFMITGDKEIMDVKLIDIKYFINDDAKPNKVDINQFHKSDFEYGEGIRRWAFGGTTDSRTFHHIPAPRIKMKWEDIIMVKVEAEYEIYRTKSSKTYKTEVLLTPTYRRIKGRNIFLDTMMSA